MNVMVTKKTGMQIGDNTNLFDWTYIENAAYAHILAADRLSPEHPKYSQVAGEAFFISNGEPRPYWDFPRGLWKAAGHVPERIVVLPKFVGMIIAIIMEAISWFTGVPALLTRFRVTYVCMTRWCNIDKARKALDYQPLYSLDEGIRLSAEVCADQA
jgi:sterol-4alpha-carboxylate 3-dehydrogenase (decarboxylating)